MSTLTDYRLSGSYHLWALWRDSEDETILLVCDLNQMVWHDVAMATTPAQEVFLLLHLIRCCQYHDIINKLSTTFCNLKFCVLKRFKCRF